MSGAALRDAVGRGRRPWLPGWAWGFVVLFAFALGLVVLAKIAPFGEGRKDPRVRTAAGAQGWNVVPMPLNSPADQASAPGVEPQTGAPPPPAPPPPEPERPPAIPPVIAYSAASGSLGAVARRGHASSVSPGGMWADEAAGGGAGGGREATELERRMQHTHLAAMRPRRAKTPTAFLLAKNTAFDCLAAEPIDSRMPGTITCIVQEPGVWNVDGTTQLIPPGSEVNAVMDRGIEAGSGQRRVWINMTDARWPAPRRDVHIPLKASGNDLMGQSGVPGDYDSNLGQRVKEAAVVAVIDIATNAATGALGALGSSTFLNFGQVGQRGGSLAQMAYERDRNIQPSVQRGPAWLLKGKVMADIDLSDFFTLSVRR